MNLNEPTNQNSPFDVRILWLVEVLLVFAAILVTCGEPTPDINESHYLTKAKHFWQPDWCDRDLFVGSPDAHWFFVASLGWLTCFFSLATSAWLMRILCWALFAVAWQRLSFQLLPKRFLSILTVVGMVLLIRYCHLAGEWIIGGVEGKSFAYVFVVFSLGWIVQKKWGPAWCCLGVATLFHVLVGGWSFLAALFAYALSRPNRAEILGQLKWLIGGVALVLIAGLVPVLILSGGGASFSDPIANEIYVRFRLPHHLYFNAFPKSQITLYFLTLLPWVAIAARDRLGSGFSRLNRFCIFTFLIGFGGILLSWLGNEIPEYHSDVERNELSDWANGLLRFYWFRMSDAMLAIGLPLVLVKSLTYLHSKWQNVSLGVLVCLVGICVFADFQVRHSDRRPPADARSLPGEGRKGRENPKWNHEHFQNWKKMCEWVKENTPEDALFLTPRDQQTFVWYAHRSQLVCYKDVPQDSEGMHEWFRRIRELDRVRDEYELLQLARKYDCNFIVVRQRNRFEGWNLSGDLERVYPENPNQKVSYEVLRIKSQR